MKLHRLSRSMRPLAVILAVATAACAAGRAPAPTAGETQGAVPDLTGVRVMAFPVQAVAGVAGNPEAEMVFALGERASNVQWIMPDELRRAVDRTPGMEISVEQLPVGVFLRAEVRRIGDPLYGNIRRLAAITNAQAAMIPVAVSYRPSEAGPNDTLPPTPGTAEVAAALLDVGSGRVFWFGIVAGEAGRPGDPGVLATAFDALARRLGPVAGR